MLTLREPSDTDDCAVDDEKGLVILTLVVIPPDLSSMTWCTSGRLLSFRSSMPSSRRTASEFCGSLCWARCGKWMVKRREPSNFPSVVSRMSWTGYGFPHLISWLRVYLWSVEEEGSVKS
jgi:hypothetical protein